jgi:hypothetical protein
VELPVRSFTIGEVTLRGSSPAGGVSVTFEGRFALRNPILGSVSTGRAQMDCDLVKRGDTLKITRFTGTLLPDASP